MSEPGRFRISRLSRFTFLGILAAIAALAWSVGAFTGDPTPERPATAMVASPRIRVITAEQYRNTIADVFGADIAVTGRFDQPTRTDGLLAIGAGLASITPAAFEQFDQMARSIAQQVVSPMRRDALIACKPASTTEANDACAKQFLAKAGRLLFRRPMTEMELGVAVRAARDNAVLLGDFYRGLCFSLAGLLASPQFLLVTEEPGSEPAGSRNGAVATLDPYSKATRLSFFLWSTTPDQELLAAAERGDLNSKRGLARQVDRLLASPRLKEGVRGFLKDYLGFDKFDDLSKDAKLYPSFTQAAEQDAPEQTLRTMIQVLLVDQEDFRDIFTTRKTFMSRALAMINGLPIAVPDGTWVPYQFPAGDKHVGILTQPAFTALHSPAVRSSPTLRGKAIREIFMCQKIPTPPANVNFKLVQDTANPQFKTSRARLTAHRTEPTCAGCHKMMDPIGLSLENFDGAGMYRTAENGSAIDTTGAIDGIDYADVQGLMQALHDSAQPSACLVDRLYTYGVGRKKARSELPWLATVVTDFATRDGYRLPALLRRIATSKAFYEIPRTRLPASQTIASVDNPGSTAAR
jgi:hypothetical protein